MGKPPKALSPGEEAFSVQCRAESLSPYREHQFALPRKWRFDFAFIDAAGGTRIAVEIEGSIWANGRHTRGSGFEADCKKYNAAAKLGWRVLRYSTEMVMRGDAIRDVLELVR